MEWLGQVPENLEVTALKRVVNPERKITYGIVQAGPHVPDGIPYIRPADMTDEHGIENADDVMRTSPEIASGYSRSTIRTGDVVCSIGPSFGKAMITPEWLDGANLTQGTARIAVQQQHDARFVFWTLRSPFSIAQWESSVGGATFRALNLAPLAETTIVIPALVEQKCIAAFLDQETAKIDALVAEQERLMALLKEKRQAVISHAVTKGLNPKAALKPSGIEWLGDVPAHWEVLSLRRCCSSVETGGTPSTDPPSAYLEQGFVWYTPGDFGDSLYLTTSTRKISNEVVASGEAKVFPPKSVLIVSIGATLGKIGFAVEASSANQQINAVIPNEKIDGYFLAYSLLVKTEVMRFLSNASTIGIMNQEKTKDIWIALPPRQEQGEISAFLDTETAMLDALTAEAQRAIDLLQERRTALISAAVTGQIDVRKFGATISSTST